MTEEIMGYAHSIKFSIEAHPSGPIERMMVLATIGENGGRPFTITAKRELRQV